MSAQGRLFAVVGPSGAGKDTLLEAACRARPDLVRARRVITRPSGAGGEAFDGVDEAAFDACLKAGQLAIHWRAHGLRYGIRASIDADLAVGRDVLFNGSRAALEQAAARYPGLRVLLVTAPAEVLMQRLSARGREDADQIAARLERAAQGIPPDLPVHEIDNSGTVDAGVKRLLAALQPERA
ncbi:MULTISPECIES: phosphonate metabolism protein/1,5-bisphosphokinase (PRPP-forming) PhnN [Sediminimonas]|uniref:phosphonate metabolism protein/1,5-bisphosphokinase (PRPP-forming) PhnN n=1 Tax=Sediminimonas TaxID=659427 RepID=UPI000409D005|nr:MULTISPECIES: phosphonate metabolism protein/1,5-bisphosphokinase (PRPP-forming) PhnN [Sediminimonas]MDR9485140.1 phosphonate metabolism protein/1,5-bisphosphokinase (PRPP-forming) PhnN [Sediminimonas sp.]